MSSDYHVLCMNHDPALMIDHEWAHSADAAAAIKARRSDGPLGEHRSCDLLIGRYSAALVEVCCPGGEHPLGRIRMHINERWVDVAWLRLLYHAYASSDLVVAEAVTPLGDCWSRNRLVRLRGPLGIEANVD
jgi:hypothetical protein